MPIELEEDVVAPPAGLTTAQGIAKSSLLLFTSQVIAKGLFFFTMVYLARVLGPDEFGKFAFAYGFVSILSVLTRFGMDILTARDVAEEPGRAPEYLKNTVVLRLLLSALFLLVLFPALLVFAKTPEVNRLVFLLAIAAIFQSLGGVATSLFEAFQSFGYRSLLTISLYASIFAGVLLAHHFAPGLSGAGYGFLIGCLCYGLLALILCHFKVTHVAFGWNLSLSTQIFRMALPLVLTEFFVGIYYRVDTILLSLFDTDQVVGWYNAAYNFVYGLRLLPMSISIVLLPALAGLFRKQPQKAIHTYRLALQYSVAAGFFLTFFFAAGAEFLVALFFGEGYSASSNVLPLLIWTCAIMFANALQASFLVVVERRAALFRATAIGAASNVILNILLIPVWSMQGAALATVLSEFLVFVICAHALSDFLNVRDLLSIFVKPVAGVALMGAFFLYFGGNSPILQWIVSPLLYLGTLFFLRGLPGISIQESFHE